VPVALRRPAVDEVHGALEDRERALLCECQVACEAEVLDGLEGYPGTAEGVGRRNRQTVVWCCVKCDVCVMVGTPYGKSNESTSSFIKGL
jgi:hypothetical protein